MAINSGSNRNNLFVKKRQLAVCILLLTGFAPTIKAQQWPVLGNEDQVASTTSNYTSIVAVAEGEEGTTTVPYVAFTEANIAKVKRYHAGTWEQVGDNISTGNATYTRIYADRNDRLLVTYIDVANGNRLAVKAYNTSTSAWEPLNGNADNLYVSSGSVTNSISQYSTTPRSSFAFDTSNVPYIIFGEGANLNPTVKRHNGTGWETVGSGTISSDRAIGVSIAIDSTTNIPYIVYVQQATSTSTTGSIIVYRYTNSGESIPVPNPVPPGSSATGATTAARHTGIAFNNNWNLVISYFNAGNSNRPTIITYNKATAAWSFDGTPVCKGCLRQYFNKR